MIGRDLMIIVLVALVLVLAARDFCCREPKVKIEWRTDTGQLTAAMRIIDSAIAVAGFERHRADSLAKKSKTLTKAIEFYRALAESLAIARDSSSVTVDIPTREFHVVIPSLVDTTMNFDSATVRVWQSEQDSISGKYIFPPIDIFTDIRLNSAPRHIDVKYPIITKTEYALDWRLLLATNAVTAVAVFLLFSK